MGSGGAATVSRFTGNLSCQSPGKYEKIVGLIPKKNLFL